MHPCFPAAAHTESISLLAVLPAVAPAVPAAIALLVLGSICFLPGFYHTGIAYLAWKGVPGYSLNDIPDM
jgi:hypothetical protein